MSLQMFLQFLVKIHRQKYYYFHQEYRLYLEGKNLQNLLTGANYRLTLKFGYCSGILLYLTFQRMFIRHSFISLSTPHKKEVVKKFLYFLQLSCQLSMHCQEFTSYG